MMFNCTCPKTWKRREEASYSIQERDLALCCDYHDTHAWIEDIYVESGYYCTACGKEDH